jgi:integrase/recombinase XerD
MGGPSRARVTGPLREHAPGFIGELARLGYTAESAYGQMLVMAHLSRWLAGEGLDAAGLTPQVTLRFLAARRAAGYRLYLSPKALGPLLGYLRGLGIAPLPPPAVPATAAGALLGRWQHHLIIERGLAPATARDYAGKVGSFVAGRENAGGLDTA